MYVRPDQRPLSYSKIFYQNFMKLSSYGPLLMKIHRFKLRPLSNLNIFFQNFMKLGHIVIPRHTLVSGYYVIPFGVCPSVRPSVRAHHFRSIT